MGHHKQQAAILFALAATCVFGRMSFVAGVSLFENPDPGTFEQLATLWAFLYWVVPALLIGTVCARRAVPVAAAVNFFGGAALLAVEYPHFVPTGSTWPDDAALWGLIAEVGTGLVIAVLNAVIVRAVYRWLRNHLTRPVA